MLTIGATLTVKELKDLYPILQRLHCKINKFDKFLLYFKPIENYIKICIELNTDLKHIIYIERSKEPDFNIYFEKGTLIEKIIIFNYYATKQSSFLSKKDIYQFVRYFNKDGQPSFYNNTSKLIYIAESEFINIDQIIEYVQNKTNLCVQNCNINICPDIARGIFFYIKNNTFYYVYSYRIIYSEYLTYYKAIDTIISTKQFHRYVQHPYKGSFKGKIKSGDKISTLQIF